MMPLIYLFLFTIFSIAKAKVPASETFQYVNEGEMGLYITDIGYGAFEIRILVPRVWEASRGNPVKENATLTFGSDSNLVLADVDGRIAWQTNTANKGVTGFKILPNGNMVLHDAKGNFIWQSFDYSTDTLLAGQSLRLGGATELVSLASALNNSDGAYSLGPLEYVKFDSTPENDDGTAYGLNYGGTLESEERIATARIRFFDSKWMETLGQCVACPTPNGLIGWNKDCNVKKLTSCNEKDFYYYKLEGVDHFLTRYTRGNAIKEEECGKKCSKDCKCLGYFYKQQSSRCWLAYDLKTLTRVANATHVAYTKAPKK
ncbi:Epidermis-specific secreted glycoprotein EP1 [Hibiscus syriacus]|uniref:Epidermis-specific secreted glycoprotein EP1 n=1 Tax=Hibiscus syriacus TaxID=106335 RepID=A0A6A2XRA8_HIBSY|nr:Epidermis-specific secreted glycoprotein EP1 [Hibiscus syriacus]